MKHRIARFASLAMAVVVSVAPALAHEVVDFERDVLPIFQRSCGGLACHMTQKTSGVELTSYEALIGSVGEQYQKPIVVPRDAAGSPLFDKIANEPPLFGEREPRGASPLNGAEISMIARWIQEGAKESHRLVRGDFNGDDILNITDAVGVLFYLFQAGPQPLCEKLADADADGGAEINDAIFVLNHLFQGGPEPEELSAEETEACLKPRELSFDSIYTKVFAASCAFSSCHSTQAHKGGLALGTRDEAYAALVGIPASNATALAAGYFRVDPGKPENSFLVRKLTKPGPGEGNRMPPNSSVGLSQSAKDAIQQWILSGAPKDGTIPGVPDISDVPLPPIDRIPVPPAPENGIQLHLGPFPIAPRSEREIFYFMGTPLSSFAEDLTVERIDIHMSDDSHHFILYEWTGAQNPPAGYRNIGGALDIISSRRFILGAQQSFFSLSFPPGVGIKLSRLMKMDLNSHYVNLHNASTLQGEVYMNIFLAAPGTVTTFAKPVFDINPFINVPPNQTRTTKAVFPQESSGRVPAGKEYHIYALGSHMHRHGVRFSSFVVTNLLDAVPPNMVYDDYDWDDPAFKLFETPLVLKAGQGIRYEATHTYDDPPSPSSPPLQFGITSEDEMAILLGYYSVR